LIEDNLDDQEIFPIIFENPGQASYKGFGQNNKMAKTNLHYLAYKNDDLNFHIL